MHSSYKSNCILGQFSVENRAPPLIHTHTQLKVLFYFLLRHMKEISELQAFQRNEIESLYRELGKTLPPSVGLLHAAPPTGRRRRASKHKLKAGKLLNPMVQQLRNNLNSSSERKGARLLA